MELSGSHLPAGHFELLLDCRLPIAQSHLNSPTNYHLARSCNEYHSPYTFTPFRMNGIRRITRQLTIFFKLHPSHGNDPKTLCQFLLITLPQV